MKHFELQQFIKDLNKNAFVKACNIPMDYKASYPIFFKKQGEVFLTVPFRKRKKTTRDEEFAVFPAGYTVTFRLFVLTDLPQHIKEITGKEEGYAGAAAVAFETLRYHEDMQTLSFDKPIDLFPHPALKELGSEEYRDAVGRVYAAYDAVLNDLLGIEACAGIDKVELQQLLSVLVEPVTKSVYERLDKDFAQTYLYR